MKPRHHLNELKAYAADAASLRDLLKLLRVRLSQTPLGPLVCPKPVTSGVRLRSFGPEPLWLRSHTSDISVLNEQLLAHGYDPVLNATPDVEVIVDLGANTGIVARWLLARYPGARIVCVEPAAENLEILRLNLAPLGARAAIVDRCIGGTERPVSIGTDNGAWAYQLREADADEANSSVVTMTRVLEEHGIGRVGLLKSDTEGAEWEMFEQCGAWIDRVDAIVVELHHGRAERLLPMIGADAWTILSRDDNPHYDFEVVSLARAVPAA